MPKFIPPTLCSVLFFCATCMRSQIEPQDMHTKIALTIVNSQQPSEARAQPDIMKITVGIGPQGIAFTPGPVWVAFGNDKDFGVVRIDANTNMVVASVRTGKWPVGVATGEGAVWIVNRDENSVTRVDPGANRAVATIAVGKRPLGVDVGEGSVWVTNTGSNSVSRIDPKTNAVVANIPVGKRPSGIAVSNGVVWVVNFASHSVSRIDPKTNAVSGTIKVVVGNPNVVIARESDVWATTQDDGFVVRIDAKSNSIVSMTKTGLVESGMAIVDSNLYVADSDHAALRRIDIRTNTFVGEPIEVGNNPIILGAGTDENGAILVSNSSDGTVMKVKP
jgi:YVTN family beta-propeller protein